MAEVLKFDPTDEASGSELSIDLAASTSYKLLEQSMPAPPLNPQWAGSVDTEGERVASRRHGNRTITHRWDVFGSSDATLETAVNALTQKVAKFQAEGGTFRRTSPSGTVRTYDVLAADGFDRPFDISYYTGYRASVSYNLTAKPYSRGAEVDLGDNVETTLPVLIFTETSVPGDVPGLGRLVIDNDDLATTAVLWGIQSRYYSNAATAALFYQAEACWQGSGTSVVTGPAGASGSSVLRHTSIAPDEVAFRATGASGLSSSTHVGSYRVWVRVYAPNTNVSINSVYTWGNSPRALVDAAGDPIENAWMLVDLGVVNLPVAPVGTQASTIEIRSVNDDPADILYYDYVILQPVTEGSGVITGGPAAGQSAHIRHDGVWVTLSGGTAYEPTYGGDYLLVPPSGGEGRTLRVLVHTATSSGIGGNAPTIYGSGGILDVSARLYVTPRYLT